MKALLLFFLTAVACFGSSVGNSITISHAQVGNVDASQFSVVWEVDDVAVPGLDIFADADGLVPLNGQLGVEFFPLEMNDVTVAQTAAQRTARRALQAAMHEKGIVLAKVTGAQPGTTYHVRPRSFDADGNANEMAMAALLPVTTAQETAFVIESRQLRVVFGSCFPDTQGLVLTASNADSPYPLFSVIGDHELPEKGFFDLSRFLNAAGTSNLAPAGAEQFTLHLIRPASPVGPTVVEVPFTDTFVVAQVTETAYAGSFPGLAYFSIEAASAPLEGEPFFMNITARASDGTVVTAYDGNVELTTGEPDDLTAGGGATPNFIDGVLEDYEVTPAGSGAITFTVTRPCGIETGSQTFNFSPPTLDITFSAATYTVFQGATVVTLTLNRGSTDPASVLINTDDGTAQTGNPPFAAAVATGTPSTSDYVDLSGAATTVAFAQDETSKTVDITLIPKVGTTIPNKRFTATITPPSEGVSLGGGITTSTIQILASDTALPTLTVTAPAATATSVSAGSPYTVKGVAGDARGISKVEVVLNGGLPVAAILGAASAPTSVPYALEIVPLQGDNTLVVTAFDLRGNTTSVTRNFSFIERFLLTITREVPPDLSATPDAVGLVALAATPSTAASALVPATANTNPKTSEIVPGTSVKLTATPKTGYVFSHWSGLPGGSVESGNVVTFAMPAADVPDVAAHFVVNEFAPPVGAGTTFFGLVHASGGTTPSNATEGFLTGTLTSSNGAFSGRVLMDGITQTFAATFYGDGSSFFTVGTAKQPTLSFGGGKILTLTYDHDDDLITATVTNGGDTSIGTAMRAIYSTANKVPAALLNVSTTAGGPINKGFYTVGFPSKAQSPAVDDATYPQGDGYCTLSVSEIGVVTLSGILADGSALTGSSALVAGNTCPIFVQLTTPGQAATVKGGSFGGVVTLDSSPADSDVTGTDLLWFRPAVTEVTEPAAAAAATKLYTDGWPSGIRVDALGALYNPAINVQTALDLDGPSLTTEGEPLLFEDGSLMVTDGTLTSPITKTNFIIKGNTVAKIPATDASFALALTASNGSFSGSFTPNWTSPSSVKPLFRGILVQKGATKGGYGFFLSNATNHADPESGHVEFKVQPNEDAQPPLTVTAPPAIVSDLSPYIAKGFAGNARGLDRVELALNGGVPIEAVLGTALATGSVPYSLSIAPNNGDNTLTITAFDLRGNSTTVVVNFHYTRRYVLTLSRSVPPDLIATPDAVGTVAMAATPIAAATSLVPATANTNPKTSKVVPGATVKLTATPKTGYVFSHWLDLPAGAVMLGNIATFIMPESDVPGATAVFVVNPFAAPAGSGLGFYGLIHPDGITDSTNATEGFFTGTLTSSSGAFSGKVLIDGLTQSFVATFYGNGTSIFTVGTTRYNALTFGGRTLTLSYNADVITGIVSNGSDTSIGVATRTPYSSANKVPAAFLNASTSKGFYTIAFSPKGQSPAVAETTYPQGYGYGTLTVSDLGGVVLAGTLADGTLVTATSALVAGNQCPIFAQIVTPGAAATVKGGSFGGVLTFDTAPAESDVSGLDLLWFRPTVTALTSPPASAAAAAATALYTQGWPGGIVVDAVGAQYDTGTNVQTGLDLGSTDADGNAELMVTDGKVNPDIIKQLNISGNTVTKIPSTDGTYAMSVSQAAGTFSGTFAGNWAPSTKPLFKGILLQKGPGPNQGGFGFFLSNITGDPDPESGAATLGKAP